MTAPASTNISIFSLSHAQLLDGATDFLTAGLAWATAPADLDMYGVRNATVTPNTSNASNEGDDAVLDYYNWLDDADVAIEQGYVSLRTLARISGQPLSSTASGPAGTSRILGIDLYHEDSMNVAPFPMLLRCPASDEDGVTGSALIGLYKVKPGPFTMNGPQYKTGVAFSTTGKCLLSRKDELGRVFADGKRRVGKLITFFPA